MSLLIILLALGLLFWMTLNKWSPFVALLAACLLIGFLNGMPVPELMRAMEKGVGSILGSMALILCLGAMQGKVLEKTGAAKVISFYLMEKFGKSGIQWAVLLMGLLVGIPLFYNAGFVILVPFVFTIAASAKVPLMYVAIPLSAALSVTHGFLPPHPGPVSLASIFNASIGKTMLYGLIVTVPLVWLAGIQFGKRFRNYGTIPVMEEKEEEKNALPSVGISIGIAILPVVLIALPAVIIPFLGNESGIIQFATAIGDPVLAMLVSAMAAGYFLCIRRGITISVLTQYYGSAIEGIAVIMMVIAGGGALKEVLMQTGAATQAADFFTRYSFPPLLAGWLVAATIRVIIGSATVAGITAAGILAPLVLESGVSPEWMVLSVGAGSIFCSHVNDTGFWMFKEYYGLTVKETLLSWTIMETIISVAGLLLILLFSLFF
jgi:gluconate transporter